MNWVSKVAALGELEKVFGFQDISAGLLARKEWTARITAEVTWVPKFQDSPGRRAVLFKGFDPKGQLGYCLVAARPYKGDEGYNIAQYIEHQGYFALPSQSKDANVYRNYLMFSSKRPLDDRPGRWALLLEVLKGSPWDTDAFVSAAFRAYGEKPPYLPSDYRKPRG